MQSMKIPPLTTIYWKKLFRHISFQWGKNHGIMYFTPIYPFGLKRLKNITKSRESILFQPFGPFPHGIHTCYNSRFALLRFRCSHVDLSFHGWDFKTVQNHDISVCMWRIINTGPFLWFCQYSGMVHKNEPGYWLQRSENIALSANFFSEIVRESFLCLSGQSLGLPSVTEDNS